MAEKLGHNWGDLMGAIDVETTGLDPFYHEIVQLSIVILDSNIDPIKEIQPFNIYMKPNFPDRMSPGAQHLSKRHINDIINTGVDQEKAKDLLEDWFSKLPLDSESINNKRIRPIGHNFKFDHAFITGWLGPLNYEMFFHYHSRDTIAIVEYINDMYAFRGYPVPFSKRSLTDLCRLLGVVNTDPHNSLSDCYATAECYKKLVKDQYWAKPTLA